MISHCFASFFINFFLISLCWAIHQKVHYYPENLGLDKVLPQDTLKFSQFAARPLKSHRPFTTVWNIQTTNCKKKYNVDVDLSSFDIVQNPDQARSGDKMTIFYKPKLGLRPYIDKKDGSLKNGGIPQNGDIAAHLSKCKEDIEHILPDPNYDGLAVIDWETWHPLWDRMAWSPFKIYQNMSINKVMNQFPHWTLPKVKEYAKLEYENAAQMYMLATLELGRQMRPFAKWGFYLYPDCYNYNKTGVQFQCKQEEIELNDRIQWLFDESTALFPSIYIGIWFKDSYKAVDWTKYRILEAFRVSEKRYSMMQAPVYAYNNLVYRHDRLFLSKQDIISTSGTAAILGTSGVVLWADMVDISKDACLELSAYVNTTLGPYMKLASDAAAECSQDFCNGNGRCRLLSSLSEYDISKTIIPFLICSLSIPV